MTALQIRMSSRSFQVRLATLLVGRSGLALLGSVLALGCSAIDEREPTLSEEGDQVVPSLRPNPMSSAGSAGTRGITSSVPGAAGGEAGSPGSIPNPGGGGSQTGEIEPGAAADPECPVDGDPAAPAPCTTLDSQPGACSPPGACTEYCAAGRSRVGACLVQPG